ncbi:hypothetical protein AVEN_257809-1 [Araneus ventricosus]|uniref:Uncharacterized protein n=1 Tax=Araneus ventricosus TaxID=182803 RepID=A0A4Y2KDQ6_ARAVE|nr:hypothetical protein AVEN_257809-1 [Araneus ventricosus]
MSVGVPGLLNDSRCDSSSAEAGVLVAITDSSPTPPQRSSYYHRREVTRSPSLLYPPGKRDPAYLSGDITYKSSTNSWCSPGEEKADLKYVSLFR